jgi:hypothetical protein
MALYASVVVGSLAQSAVVLQSLTGRSLLAAAVTFLLLSVFYAVTLHLAATFFIGDVKSQQAAYVGPVPAAVSILLGQYGLEAVAFVSRELGVLIVLVMTLIADALAISRSYKLAPVPTAALTLLHLAFTAVLGVALGNLLGFL